MKSKILFVAAFVCGIILGAIAQSSSATNQTSPPWKDTEETVLQRMATFQNRLDNLKPPQTTDNIDTLTKQIEAQLGIENILIQYRQGQQAKYGPLVPTVATLIVGAMGIVGIFLSWYLTKRSKSATHV